MNFLNLVLEFFQQLYLKKTTPQEPPRENIQDKFDGVLVIDEPVKAPKIEEPQEVTYKPAEKSLWCPFAVKRKEQMAVKGKYRKGYPEGAVVHFTAGGSAESSFQYGVKKGFCFFVISEDGVIHQAFPLDSWGYHAGESFHPKLGNGVSKYLVGIEVANPGKLTKKPDGSFETWFGKKIESKNVRHYPKQTKNIEAGYYAAFTEAQESSLRKLIRWLKENNPTVFEYDLVLGHDEVAPKRKNDPGGALSQTMTDFRSSFS
jgi:hypothetical protein